MKKFDSIIFDLDGTLWDTSEACAKAWNNVIERNNINFREISAVDVRSVTGKPHAECIQTIFSTLSDKEISILTEETMREDTAVIKEQGGDLYEGVSEGLFILDDQYDLFVVSNCQSGYIENFLSQNKLARLFRDYLCWGDTRKPKPINTKQLIKRNNLSSPVLVGDMEGDYEAAVACEIEFFQVTYGFGLPINGCKTADNFSQLVGNLT
jgi:phosphoglycolate phosphatase